VTDIAGGSFGVGPSQLPEMLRQWRKNGSL